MVLMAEFFPTAIMVLMPFSQADTAFEYTVIFVCWITLGSVNSIGSANVK